VISDTTTKMRWDYGGNSARQGRGALRRGGSVHHDDAFGCRADFSYGQETVILFGLFGWRLLFAFADFLQGAQVHQGIFRTTRVGFTWRRKFNAETEDNPAASVGASAACIVLLETHHVRR
jgi:hypothetical protein